MGGGVGVVHGLVRVYDGDGSGRADKACRSSLRKVQWASGEARTLAHYLPSALVRVLHALAPASVDLGWADVPCSTAGAADRGRIMRVAVHVGGGDARCPHGQHGPCRGGGSSMAMRVLLVWRGHRACATVLTHFVRQWLRDMAGTAVRRSRRATRARDSTRTGSDDGIDAVDDDVLVATATAAVARVDDPVARAQCQEWVGWAGALLCTVPLKYRTPIAAAVFAAHMLDSGKGTGAWRPPAVLEREPRGAQAWRVAAVRSGLLDQEALSQEPACTPQAQAFFDALARAYVYNCSVRACTELCWSFHLLLVRLRARLPGRMLRVRGGCCWAGTRAALAVARCWCAVHKCVGRMAPYHRLRPKPTHCSQAARTSMRGSTRGRGAGRCSSWSCRTTALRSVCKRL